MPNRSGLDGALLIQIALGAAQPAVAALTLLTLTLPVVLYVDATRDSTVVQVYLDALAAVVAFYFGASVSQDTKRAQSPANNDAQ